MPAMTDVRIRVGERLRQHLDNLALWADGTLTPTEPDPHERECVIRELKAAIAELEPLADMYEKRFGKPPEVK